MRKLFVFENERPQEGMIDQAVREQRQENYQKLYQAEINGQPELMTDEGKLRTIRNLTRLAIGLRQQELPASTLISLDDDPGVDLYNEQEAA